MNSMMFAISIIVNQLIEGKCFAQIEDFTKNRVLSIILLKNDNES